MLHLETASMIAGDAIQHRIEAALWSASLIDPACGRDSSEKYTMVIAGNRAPNTSKARNLLLP
jgi:hypothetical protein